MLPAASLHSLFAGASGLFRTFAGTAAPLAVDALWQGILLSAALALCLKFAPRLAAAHRFALWFAGFGVLVSLPLLSALAFGAASAATVPPGSLAASAPRPWFLLDPRWSIMIAALWLAASTFRAAELLVHAIRLRTLGRTSTSVELPPELAFTGSRPFLVCSTQALDRPSVIGFFAPRILIPDWLFPRLTPGELRQIVLHEAEHLRRRDDWTNLFQKLCMVVFPLNLALWWMDRRLAKEREMACDEGVVRITQAPRAYAACLASLAERGLSRRQTALSLGAWQRRPELVHRVHSLLRRRPALHPFITRTVLAAVGAGLLAITFELARCPQFVGFAPAQSTQSIAATVPSEPAGPMDAAFTSMRPRPTTLARFHAVPAVAQFPVAVRTQSPMNRAAAHRTIARNSVSAIASAPAPHAENLPARSTAAAAPPQPEQWIVFTEWQQVETAPAHTQAIADYDTTQSTDAPGQPNTTTDATQSQQPTRHTTVTRLIFRVVPSNSNQPTAIPFANGWIVIQL